MRSSLQRLREYDQIADIGQIARRYFAMNAFDGILTMIGILMGNFTAGVSQPNIVVSTGLATSVAMAMSGLWGTYMTETAERRRSLDDLEDLTLSDLSDTRIGEASRAAIVIVTLVDSVSSFGAALVVLTPFFLASWVADIAVLYWASIAIALLSLVGLGIFLGRLSRTNILIASLKMLVAGVLTIGITYLLKVQG
jgi:predicted membrane protein (TIGR00267 family)